MGTTPQGIWYPDAGAQLNPLQTKFSTMATSIDDLLKDPNKTRTVRWFDTASDRNAAIPSPSPGVIAAIGSTSSFQLTCWDGSQWRAIYAPLKQFNPVWSGLTLGNGAQQGWWSQSGNIVHATVSVVFGSTTTLIGNPYLTWANLPTPVYASVGSVVAYDYSAGQFVPGTVVTNDWVSFPAGRWSSTVPFTWTSQDRLQLSATYMTA